MLRISDVRVLQLYSPRLCLCIRVRAMDVRLLRMNTVGVRNLGLRLAISSLS